MWVRRDGYVSKAHQEHRRLINLINHNASKQGKERGESRAAVTAQCGMGIP